MGERAAIAALFSSLPNLVDIGREISREKTPLAPNLRRPDAGASADLKELNRVGAWLFQRNFCHHAVVRAVNSAMHEYRRPKHFQCANHVSFWQRRSGPFL